MPISRRRFLGGISASLLSGAKGTRALGRGLQGHAAQGTQFAYVSSEANGAHGIHVLRAGERHWQHVQFVPSPSPASMVLSPDRRILFVTNRVRSVAGLPTGAAESYRINDATGTLTLISRRTLALSAIEPEHLAVSPDGHHLAIAATGGGSYNLLPIAADGSLLAVSSLRKELGFGTDPARQTGARPQQVLFDAQRRLLGFDSGMDVVSVFEDHGGVLSAQQRVQMQPGSGPNVMSFDRTGTILCVGSCCQPTIAAHRYDVREGRVSLAGSTLVSGRGPLGAWRGLASHPRADLMLGAWSNGETASLVSWHVDVRRGELRRMSELDRAGDVTALATSEGELDLVMALDRRNEQVLCLRWDAISGKLSSLRAMAEVPQPRALVVRRSGSYA